MTSSLVGSEMCIRDRTHRVSAPSSGGQKTCKIDVCGGGEGVDITATVSYTHLTLPTICSV
eukprot:24539-Prorocentrum_lima.AAC.1